MTPCPFAVRSLKLLLALVLLLSTVGQPAAGEKEAPEAAAGPKSLADATAGLEPVDGFFTTYPDPRTGRLWLRLPAPDENGLVARLLYVAGLKTGLGSNPVGLDRGQIDSVHVVEIVRLGPKVLIQATNQGFRADTEDAGERRATRESFAPSVLWAGSVVALDADGTSLVDLVPFLIRDAHGIEGKTRETEQGKYALDPARSAVDFGALLSFPDNLELEALLTYAQQGDEPGELIAATAPIGEAFSVVQHYSLIRLPDDGFEPRPADPRMGFFGPSYRDYAAPLTDTVERRLAARHRLQKADPSKEVSKAVEPIVYYVDHAAPEPIRSALLDGARWWEEAFRAAGFEDGFRVEVLPEDAHPLDVRYNVIQWVHRSTRGWSYGNAVMDPRTGEIVKGHVSLGSLRVRQDRLIFEGLLGVEKTGTGDPDDPVQIALARIRQLSAHEVGHTLGLTHNFAASTYGDRESVMDYPAPWIRPATGGGLDVSQAYGVGIGEWDKLSIRYGYAEPAPGVSEQALLADIVQEGLDRGLLFLSDHDARPPGAADPRANLWDNGTDAVEALEEALEVRRIALDGFDLGRLPRDRPVALLHEVLVPVYLYHRYQLDAALKTVAGVEYAYAVKGDGQPVTAPVSAERQERALQVVLGILDPEVLDLPDRVLELLAPRPWLYDQPNRELFKGGTDPLFDPVSAALVVADQVISGLLQPERLARSADLHRRFGDLPGPRQILDATSEAVFGAARETPRRAALRREVQRLFVHRLLQASRGPAPNATVSFEVDHFLEALSDRLAGGSDYDKWLAATIDRFFERPFELEAAPEAPPAPPGSPIGQAQGCGFDHEGPGIVRAGRG